MRSDVIRWNTLTQDSVDKEYYLVNFQVSLETENQLQLVKGSTVTTENRLRNAVATRGYQIVNINWLTKVLYLKKA